MARPERARHFMRAPSIDPVSAAYLAAVEAQGGTVTPAIRTAIRGLVNNITNTYPTLLAKLFAIYPYTGGVAGSHSLNLLDPRDNDAAYRISWTGGVTHDANGITGNGSTGFGDTHFNASTTGFTNVSGGLSCYNRNNTGSGYDMGSSDSAVSKCTDLVSRYSGGTTMFGFHSSAGGAASASNTDSRGLHLMQRSGGNIQIYRNGTSLANSAVSAASGLANRSIYILCENRGGVAIEFTNHNHALGAIHGTLTVQENADWYTTVQAFQTALSRNV